MKGTSKYNIFKTGNLIIARTRNIRVSILSTLSVESVTQNKCAQLQSVAVTKRAQVVVRRPKIDKKTLNYPKRSFNKEKEISTDNIFHSI